MIKACTADVSGDISPCVGPYILEWENETRPFGLRIVGSIVGQALRRYLDPTSAQGGRSLQRGIWDKNSRWANWLLPPLSIQSDTPLYARIVKVSICFSIHAIFLDVACEPLIHGGRPLIFFPFSLPRSNNTFMQSLTPAPYSHFNDEKKMA